MLLTRKRLAMDTNSLIIRRSDDVLYQVYQTKFESPVLAVSPLNTALLVGCEDGSLNKIVLKDEVICMEFYRPRSELTELLN